MVRGKPAGEPSKPRQEPQDTPKAPAADGTVETTDNTEKSERQPEAPKRKAKPWESMTDEVRSALMHQHKARIAAQREVLAAAVAEKNTQNGVLRKLIQTAQSELGPDCMDYIKILEKLDTPEGEEEVRRTLKITAKVFDWGNVKEGAQLSMFWEEDAVDIRPDSEVAENEGRIAAFQNKVRQPPAHYPPGGAKYGAWLEGYAKGQDILMSRIKAVQDQDKAADDAPIGEETATYQTVSEDPPADRDLSGIAEQEPEEPELEDPESSIIEPEEVIPPALDRKVNGL